MCLKANDGNGGTQWRERLLGASERPPAPASGLCDSCVHQRLVPNTRGSVFSLCERSQSDPGYPRYPRVAVLACPGHESRPRSSS